MSWEENGPFLLYSSSILPVKNLFHTIPDLGSLLCWLLPGARPWVPGLLPPSPSDGATSALPSVSIALAGHQPAQLILAQSPLSYTIYIVLPRPCLKFPFPILQGVKLARKKTVRLGLCHNSRINHSITHNTKVSILQKTTELVGNKNISFQTLRNLLAWTSLGFHSQSIVSL